MGEDNIKSLVKSKGGRPTVWKNKEIVEKLEAGLKTGFTVEQACLYAGIDKGTYYNRLREDDGFSTKMEKAQLFTTFAAKRNINRAIVEDKSVVDAWKWLERKYPEEFPRDGAKIAVGVQVPVTVEGKEVSDEQLARRIIGIVERIKSVREGKDKGDDRGSGQGSARKGNRKGK